MLCQTTRHRGRPIAVIVGAALFLAAATVAHAQEWQRFVGTWYGDEALQGTEEGKRYDFRRWIAHQRDDRTGTNRFRYYAGGKMVSETIEEFEWNLEKSQYTERCKSRVVDGAQNKCLTTVDRYRVTTLTPNEFVYFNSQKRRYRMVKMRSDFQLP